ncbi:radical SAM protein [bacterium]|nr:radical SAM protein [candidate division CSSED10-310 bacterium]
MVEKQRLPKSMQYIFGPVASRRLGRSLGIDLIPFKTCTLNCRYCECGPTTHLTIERRKFGPETQILDEIEYSVTKLQDQIDFITFAGSGEPTLSLSLSSAIKKIKEISTVPVAMLTNGTLLYRPDVLLDISSIDVLIPSLDVVNADMFDYLNRPHPDLCFDQYIEGLKQLRKKYQNTLWLEILLCKGINDSAKDLELMKKLLQEINPDAIQMNTVFRPGTDPDLKPLSEAELSTIQRFLGYPESPRPAIIGGIPVQESPESLPTKRIREILQRRPSTVDDLANGLQVSLTTVRQVIHRLSKNESLIATNKNGQIFYSLAGDKNSTHDAV